MVHRARIPEMGRCYEVSLPELISQGRPVPRYLNTYHGAIPKSWRDKVRVRQVCLVASPRGTRDGLQGDGALLFRPKEGNAPGPREFGLRGDVAPPFRPEEGMGNVVTELMCQK